MKPVIMAQKNLNGYTVFCGVGGCQVGKTAGDDGGKFTSLPASQNVTLQAASVPVDRDRKIGFAGIQC
ncbi:hypothetical protein BG55_05155 [Erwinia mallotivora]|uniref:Lipoprotein n=1 Tax=Erwinia mallotivora TaxID=69222 RepID=A0A014PZT5_9GAMM|nr:hypothetical protein BG55_05155 [Erwinia mallotivora]